MNNPQVGDRFLVQVELVRLIENGEIVQGQPITNYFMHLWWGKIVGADINQPLILVCTDDIHPDPLAQAIEAANGA